MRADYAAYLAIAAMYSAKPTVTRWRLLLAASDLKKHFDTVLGVAVIYGGRRKR